MNRIFAGLVLIGLLASLLFLVPGAAAAPEWAPYTNYAIGDQVTYAGQLYQCRQAHQSLPGWEPPYTLALWLPISGPTNTPAGASATATRAPTRTNTVSGPTRTATRTSTRTNTPVGPSTTPSRTPTRSSTPSAPSATPSRTPTTGGGTGCWPAWVASTAYNGGAQVSYSGANYQAAFWTQNQRPDLNSGPAGSGQPWIPKGACGPAPTPSRTITPGGPTATRTATALPGTIPARVFAPYADISFTSVQAAMQPTGQRYYALSFVLGSGGACVPAWDGTHVMAENYYLSEVNAIRAAGGDVIAVFGGANGSDMASVCTTVSSLQAAYQAVVDQYQFRWIDLNVEGGMVSDAASVDRRNKAIRALQLANPGLKVSYTLPVLQSGLLQNALDLLNNAKSNGVRIDYVNVMTMNYGPWGVDMGQAAIDASTNTHNQVAALGISTQIGITPMIGQNNTQGEIFSLSDADEVLAYARGASYVGWLSFWSVGRDNGGCPGQTAASASCSGISQGSYDFTVRFRAFP
jgi:chitodextrinase